MESTQETDQHLTADELLLKLKKICKMLQVEADPSLRVYQLATAVITQLQKIKMEALLTSNPKLHFAQLLATEGYSRIYNIVHVVQFSKRLLEDASTIPLTPTSTRQSLPST